MSSSPLPRRPFSAFNHFFNLLERGYGGRVALLLKEKVKLSLSNRR